jgi:phage protein D
VDLAACFGESVAYVTDIPVQTQIVAKALATVEMERLARQFCRGTASIQGDDTVRAGTMVEFSGLNEGQNGKYFIIATRHIVSSRTGYTTELTFCSNTMGT